MDDSGREETFLVDPGAGEKWEKLGVGVAADVSCGGAGVEREWAERDGC